MVWQQLDINRPHLVYIILGGFTSLFMLCSSIIKERLYIGEATVATICGIIFGPHAANLINPMEWGNTDQITLEFSRIVLVVQCFAVGVELPKAYMERHWRSVTFLLVPVMTFGWLITSLFVWGLIPDVNWLDSLAIAACVTATDPVLASSVVGKGKFAKRVPKHLRDLLSAESGCNDGMAFPFIYLALYVLQYKGHTHEVALHWFCYTILYECIFGAFYGVCVGYLARRAIRYAHERDIIDRESFLVFYFVLALFCAGSGSMLGMDDLLIGFSCGVGFSNDGWFTEKTEESHVSNVIDLLINLAFFVYFGTIIPWEQYNANILGLTAWRLVVIGILVLLFRRIPIMILLKPVIPDIKTWREALFAGHFGPIGVGAIFVSILARAELETETTTPLAILPPEDFDHYNIIRLIWPVTSFLVICSIVVHGSSIAVFTLGKHINTLTLTLSYTQANEDTTWMDRLPRIQSRSKSSMSLRRPDDTESSLDEKLDFPAGVVPKNFLRRQREDETPSRASSRRPGNRRRHRDSSRGPGGPITQSAIGPVRSPLAESQPSPFAEKGNSDSDTLAVKSDDTSPSPSQENKQTKDDNSDRPGEKEGEVFEEGQDTVYEDEEGNVLEVEDEEGLTPEQRQDHEATEARNLMSKKDVHHGISRDEENKHETANLNDEGTISSGAAKVEQEMKDTIQKPKEKLQRSSTWRKGTRNFVSGFRNRGDQDEPSSSSKRSKQPKQAQEPVRGPARAYQFGNTIIVEDEDGEVIKKYDIPAPPKKNQGMDVSFTDPKKTKERMQRMGSYLGVGRAVGGGGPSTAAAGSGSGTGAEGASKDDEDEKLRFTISAGGRRMSKVEFIKQIQQLDPKMRAQVVEESDAPEAVKEEARADADEHDDNKRKHSIPNFEETPENIKAYADDTDNEDEVEIQKVASNDDRAKGPEGLTLVDSNRQDIPFHDVSTTLDRHRVNTGAVQETAAQRRRREALEKAQRGDGASDSEDDGTERVPPRRTTTSGGKRSGTTVEDENGETAAERRRREQALGVSKEESDSEDENSNQPRQPAAAASRPGIRFADEPFSPREQQSEGGRAGPSRGSHMWGRRHGGQR